jgi:signal recognition particle subunit SRP68
MDITNFIVSRRETASLAGDYKTYTAQNSRRLHTIRKKLGQTTPRGRKYAAKPPITAENIASNEAYVFDVLCSLTLLMVLSQDMFICSLSAPKEPGPTQCT